MSGPDGYIVASLAAAHLADRLREVTNGVDPAPWYNPAGLDYEAFALGKNVEELQRMQKFNERVVSTFQRALLRGELRAVLRNNTEFCDAPSSAFVRIEVVRNALTVGRVELDPFWPDDWQVFSGCELLLLSDHFFSWLASDNAIDVAGLSERPISAISLDIVPIAVRHPSFGDRVSLSEAVSFITFGIALDGDRFRRALQWGRLAEGNLDEAQWSIATVLDSVLTAGTKGLVKFYGRHFSREQGAPRTEEIPSFYLEDYRQYFIDTDCLFYGGGLTETLSQPYDYVAQHTGRPDYFQGVSVNRDEVMAKFTGAATVPFSDVEVCEWMQGQRMMSADRAHKEFRKHPRTIRMKQPEFRNLWRETKKTTRGRPLKLD